MMERQQFPENDVAISLLKDIQAKDARALTKLHALMGKRIYTFAVRMTRDSDLANQVVTDTLYDVWRFPDRFNGQSLVRTWLLAIAKHKALHALRQGHSVHVDLDEITETLAGDTGDPELSSLGAERAAALWRCVQQLPELHRECLHMVYYEGLSLDEVAGFQQVPEGTVKTRLFHARRKLQACLGTTLE